ncbi:MAG: hypothetical protein HY473_01245 [Candidatus Sungbacteria bacterium]|uniref:TrpR like protein, YerC/YecD n=1 Tax=Candidatus Sungiibacteriota bacterium TaxID=2750080 RepID=A0A932YZ95_9BACT|nr:hypothetical protein [Candidatus Sungbacteria bacterium]
MRRWDIVKEMAKVSKNPLSAETRNEMMAAFIRTLAKINDDSLLRRFLDDLLTPTEELMLAKRLMAAVLLQRGYSYGAVCRVLKMSKTTVFLIQRELLKSGQGYRKVFELFFRASKGQRLINAIERFLDAVTLPVKGSPSSMRRWKRALSRL